MGRDTELFKAAQNGNIEYLEKVFAAYLAKDKDTPHRGGRVKKHSGLSLRKGASPNMQDEQGYTLLHHASLNGQRDTVCLLLQCGASTTIPDCSGSGPLHLAAWKGDLEVVKALISQGPSRANVNQQNDTDNTPLHLAAQYGYSVVVDYLLQRHADPMLHNCQGETPLDLAAQYGHLDAVHLLISHCPELLTLSRGKFSPLHLAARNGHTLVALSLINAGISVNVMGEHGTPLHEAALFGKPETVKMLLDKGASTETRDRASKTVLEALREFPAEKAREITKIIEEHKEETTSLGVSPHVVAVASNGCTPASAASSALAFTGGDHILVVSRSSKVMFEGSVHGKSGSFLAQDVVFHKEVGGQLVAVESPDDIFPPPPSPSSLPSHHHTHPSNDVANDNEAPPTLPARTYVTRRYSNQELEPPVGSEVRGGRHGSVPLPVKMKKLSRKEKKFQLSRDDGAYCELSAVDPVTAVQSDAAGNVRLNPIGPAFLASFPGQPQSPSGAVTTAHNGPTPTVAKQPSNGDEFIGSYYVLEVGNFEEKGEEEKEEGVREREGGEEDIPAAYYMLDVAHVETEGERTKGRSDSSRSYENISSPQATQQYENVEVKKTSGPKYENVGTRRCHERQKSSPMGIPWSSGRGEGERVGGHDDTTMVRRMSTSLPSSQLLTGDVARERLIAAAANVGTETKERSRSQNESPPEVKGRLPRTQKSREQIYEKTSVTFSMRRSSSSQSGEVGGANSDESSDKKSAEGEMAKVNGEAAGISVAVATTDRKTDPSSLDTGEEVKDGEREEPLTRMLEPNGVPFAGLVLSSSAGGEEEEQEGGGEGEGEGEGSRPRTETIWDDCRVQREWNQIDSLLKDMSGSISRENLALSPSPPANLRSWLADNAMEKYTSNLETNGFDCLLFLGRGLLMAEDLQDVGVTNTEDQLTLQATSHLLPPPPSLGGVSTVTEWLEALQLTQLSNKFEGLTLKKISRMWDIELTSVVGVELLGHRRRLLYGISELVQSHPQWSSPSLTTHWEKLRRRREAPPPSQTTPSLFRDYTAIQPLPRQQSLPSSPTTSPIELRPPLESQSQEDASRPHSLLSSSSSWRHSVASLINETVNYEAKYLGSVIVVRVKGKQSTEEACLRLRTSTENMQKLPDVILSVAWKGVKFIDGQSKIVVSTHSIQDISYCSQDIEDKRVFAYITKDKTGMFYSHVFMATSEVIAEEILLTIGQAFEIAYQKVQKARAKLTPPRNSN